MSLGVRWTIGDVDPRGFEALRLSIHGMWQRFGGNTQYGVCFNTLPLEEIRKRTGPLPVEVRWIRSDDLLPGWLRASPLGHSIVGIYQAHRRHGGEGAFYVYLKRQR